MLSVQTPGGLVFGTGRRLEGLTLGFELDGRMEAGDVVEFRIELPGLEESAMGTLRVLAGRKDPGATVTWWTATIASISPDDQEIFEVWRRGVEHGTRAFSHTTRTTDEFMASTTMVGSSDSERRLAVAAQEERRKRRLERAKTLAKNARAWPDPSDLEGGRSVASGTFRSALSGSVSRPAVSQALSVSQGGERPRSQIAAALRGRAEGGAAEPLRSGDGVLGGQSAPPRAFAAGVSLSASPSASAAPPAPARAAPAPPAPPPSTGPAVYVDKRMASLGFTDVASWRKEHQPALLAGVLVLAHPHLAPVGEELQLWLRLPSGTTVTATGTVAAADDRRSELHISLAPPARRMVELG